MSTPVIMVPLGLKKVFEKLEFEFTLARHERQTLGLRLVHDGVVRPVAEQRAVRVAVFQPSALSCREQCVQAMGFVGSVHLEASRIDDEIGLGLAGLLWKASGGQHKADKGGDTQLRHGGLQWLGAPPLQQRKK